MSGPTNSDTAKSRPRVGTARAALAPVTEPAHPAGVADPRAERDGDDERDEQGEPGVHEVLEDAVRDAVGALPVGRVGEPAPRCSQRLMRPPPGSTASAPATTTWMTTSKTRARSTQATMPTHDLGREGAGVAVGEEVAELRDADERGDADDADVAHRGHPQPGRDDRHGERAGRRHGSARTRP